MSTYLERAHKLYRRARYNALNRNVVFEFGPKEWIVWWENNLGVNWIKKRGRRRNQYCMARKGDKGPYATWNVDCILTLQNCADRKTNGTAKGAIQIGEKNNKAKLTSSSVLKIFKAKGPSSEVCKSYGVSQCTVNDIRKGRSWTHVTKATARSVSLRMTKDRG